MLLLLSWAFAQAGPGPEPLPGSLHDSLSTDAARDVLRNVMETGEGLSPLMDAGSSSAARRAGRIASENLRALERYQAGLDWLISTRQMNRLDGTGRMAVFRALLGSSSTRDRALAMARDLEADRRLAAEESAGTGLSRSPGPVETGTAVVSEKHREAPMGLFSNPALGRRIELMRQRHRLSETGEEPSVVTGGGN